MDKNRLKELECKYVTERIRALIPKFIILQHIHMENLLVIRSKVQEHFNPLHIYSLSKSLSYVWGIYYVVEVQPSFDLLQEYQQWRVIYHTLKHIPIDYENLAFNRLEVHNIEMFNGEEMFDTNFKQNLGLGKGDYNG